MTGEGRSFTTPGYSIYSGTGTCSWNITVPPGKFIKLNFWSFKDSCDKNYAEVFDVTKSTSKALTGKICDEKVVYSAGNNVLVNYVRQGSASYHAGFVASYEALEAVPAKYSCSGKGYSTVLTSAGEFASIDYPLAYRNNDKCLLTLQVPVGRLVQVTFHSFHLQQSQGCQADYVEFKSGKSRYDPKADMIGRFCGSSLPASFTSNYSKVFVEFVTDSSGRYPGFHATFKAVPNRKYGRKAKVVTPVTLGIRRPEKPQLSGWSNPW